MRSTRRPRARTFAVAGAAVVVLGGAVTVANGLGGGAGTANDESLLPPATTKVVEETLLDTTTKSGELGFGAVTTTSSKLTGTITRLPSTGDTISRGEPLYEVDDVPVVLLHGRRPAYRELAAGAEGPDVEQLETNLAALGYVGFDIDEEYTGYTAAAVKQWQEDRGLEETGLVALGSVVFAPGTVRIDSLTAQEGDSTAPGQDVLGFTGSASAVTVELDTTEQRLAEKGRKVTIDLPGGESVAGVVSEVTATVQPATEGQAAETVLEVIVDLSGKKDQKTAAPFPRAAVDVTFVVDERKDVLTVPVVALLALREGGLGLEVVEGGASRYVSVSTGLFADGKVEVSGDGIAAGTVVGVPK